MIRGSDPEANGSALISGEGGNDIEREVVAANVTLCPRFLQQPLLSQLARQIGNPGTAERRYRAVRLPIGEVHHCQSRRDLCTGRAFQPYINLVLQKLAGLIEQVDPDQPIGEPTDHLIATTTDRRQFTVFVENRQRFDRRKIVALLAEEKLRKQRRSRVLA